MLKHQDQKNEKGHRTKVHAWSGKRILKKNMGTTKCPLPTPGCTLSTSLLSSHPSSLTSLLAPHSLLSPLLYSRPDSLAFLLSHVPTLSYLYSLRIPALSTSLLSLNPYSLSHLYSLHILKIRKTQFRLPNFLWCFFEGIDWTSTSVGGVIDWEPPKKTSRMTLSFGFRVTSGGLGWPIHHLRVSMSNFGWFEGTSILESLHVTTRKLNGMMVCTE